MRSRKRRIYVGCEGDSELIYIQWLRRLIQSEQHLVYLKADNLRGGGLGEMARRSVANFRRLNQDEHFSHRFLLLDRDRADLHGAEVAELKAVLPKHDEQVIWQNPCGQALLLATAWIEAPERRVRIATSQQAREEFRRFFDTDGGLDIWQMVRMFPKKLVRLRELDPMPPVMMELLDAIGIGR